MEKTYDPQSIEQSWYQKWEKSGYFLPKQTGEPYCIMLPPPNVTGTLHMGHGFQVTLMDTLIRYHRMSGKNTLWQVGTDHAGIATQMVVERQLQQEGTSRCELGRDAFIQRTWEWKNHSDSTIKNQLRRMGASVDWSREKFSLDEEINVAVVKVFNELYDQGLIYRGKRLVNWDPVLLTAISDLEVNMQEEGYLWHFRYPIKDSPEMLIVATTRPETIFGDTAVAVHPNDERYHAFIGKEIHHPLTGRKIPIIADEFVLPTFGTGCVKITPAHDFTDYAVGQRHHLPLINIFTATAHLNENVPAAYQGIDRHTARKKVVQELERLGLLEKVQPYHQQIPRGDRSGVVIEPYLTDQWYIKAKPLAEEALKVVKEGKINFVPENWNKTYFQWLENIQDWCISRQLWWGHRIPAWYDDMNNVYVGESETAVRQKYQLAENIGLTQDNDVLDTWFSASLWPFVTLGWPVHTHEFETFYPTRVLVTGFDILFFWVARMVMMGLKFTEKVPFETVYITGLIRDNEGQKMSKSKGNILDPLDLAQGIDLASLVQKRTHGLMQPEKAKAIENATRRDFPNGIPAFGIDALRFTYCALANTGRDIRFDLARTEGYRNFCNKIWNAARYVLMNTENYVEEPPDQEMHLNLADRWIISRLQQTIANALKAYVDFRFDLLAQTLYEFTWNEYCDWYLEFSKPILTGENLSPSQQRATRHTLLYVLETLLRLIHPIMPFITEEIWQRVAPLMKIKGDTIMLQPYPQFDEGRIDTKAVVEIEGLKEIIVSIRQIRSEMNINPGKRISLLFKGEEKDKNRIDAQEDLLKMLAKVETIHWLESETCPPASASALIGHLELYIPLAGLIDVASEIERLKKEDDKLEKESSKIQDRLNNPSYREKAPAHLVEKERLRVEEIKEVRNNIKSQKELLHK